SYTTINYTSPFPYTEYHYTYSDNKVLGWTAKVELRAAPLKFAAIGLGIFYNYNKQISFGGAVISLEIGKFR
ncbi:MAG TPA: hypothetical protein VFJ43_08290, partial [Bacteroidia bacterium]|nr:hypothetical protein [Bacteroidia bacterium]